MVSSLSTSFLFLSNAAHALWKQKFLYGISFLFLTVSSILLRKVNEEDYSTLLVIDRAYIGVVVLLGFLYFLKLSTLQKVIPLCLFLLIVIFYSYGKQNECFTCDKDYETSHFYQSMIHLVSSLGHHCILFCLA